MNTGINSEIKSSHSLNFEKIYSKYGMFLILLVIVIISSLASPIFFTAQNITNVIRQIAVVTIIAFGETFILILGMIDLSVGSVLALTGCIATGVMKSTGSLTIAVLSGLILGAIIGLINGFVITKFRIPSFIMTLAMMTIARGLVLIYTEGMPITDLGNFLVLGQGSIWIIPTPIVIMLAVFAISWLLLNKTKFGRYIYAIGGNEAAAIASGIKTNKIIIMAYTYCGILTAMGGIVLMSRINSGQPAAGTNYEFDAVTAAIVGGTSLMGGTGNIPGTLVGALIVGIINNVLTLLNVSSYYQMVVKGLIIAGAVILDVKTKSMKTKNA
jgi:inositol transport system permease protein